MTSEVYPNAPIVLAVCEVRYPIVDIEEQHFSKLKAALLDVLPIGSTDSVQSFDLTTPQPTIESSRVYRLRSRDLAMSASFQSDRVFVETTAYSDGYGGLRRVLAQVIQAVEEVLAPAGVQRIGLRYIDEIRPPVLPAGAEWGKWLTASLLGPAALPLKAAIPTLWQGLAVFETGTDTSVVLRYGPRDTFAVDPKGPLSRRETPTDPRCFVLDFDSFWEARGTIPPFERAGVLQWCDVLHEPLSEMFEQLITDDLRRAMRGEMQ